MFKERSRTSRARFRAGVVGTALVGAAALLAGPSVSAASASTAATPNTFTTIATSANPVLVGVNFTVSGMECDRVANTQATGKLVFTDVTTGVILGKVALTPDPTFVNCSDASVTDTESLVAGTYKIRDKYVPGGTNPIQGSAAAHYLQKVQNARFTNITWTTGATVPNAHIEGAAVALGGAVYDISGSTTDCSDAGCGTIQPAVDVYHPATNTFTAAPAIPNPRTEDPSAVVAGGKIYMLGGINGGAVRAIDVYTPGSGWTTLPAASDLPAAFGTGEECAAAVGTNIYYFDNASHSIGTLNTAANPPSWTVSAPYALLNPSLFCSAVTAGSQIVLVGPGNGSADANSQRVLIFTPASGSLVLAQGKSVPTAEQSAANLDGTVVLAGGDFNFNAVEGVAPGQGSVATYSNLPDNRDDAAGGSVVNGKFYIVGGQSTTSNTPAVLIGTPN